MRMALQWLLSCIIVVVAASAAPAETTPDATAPSRLTCEYMADPMGIDAARPRLSWVVPCDKQGQKQTAYRILVADSPEKLERGEGNLWDSGRVASDQSALVEYAGPPLGSRTRCFWKVRVWDKDNRESAWSEPARWSMGLLAPSDWTSRWITGGKPEEKGRSPSTFWLRKTFDLDAKPQHAEVYLASLGYHELYINGNRIGDAALSPAVSDYRHRTLYATYDVASHLTRGKNCIAVWLGRGWAAHQFYGLPNGAMVRAQLEAALPGGRTVQVATDATWKWRNAPITYLGSGNFGDLGGERLDGPALLPNWNTAALNDSTWAAAVAFDPPTAKISAQMVQPNRIIEKIKPVDVRKLGQNSYVVDMGRNFTGWFQAMLVGQPGQTVQIDYSERPVTKPGEQTFNQRDQCVIGARGKQVFVSRFNYHTFRWVTLTGLAKPPREATIRGYLIHTDYPSVGRFECSNPLFNKIYETTVWSYRCLSLGGCVVDCPHRERLGYGAEGQASMETGIYAFDQGALFTQWLQSWRDVQDPGSGSLPNSAPQYFGGGGPAWGGIVVTLPWTCYLHYGDRRILETNYPMMQAYLRWLGGKCKDNIIRPYGGEWDFLADWVAPGRNTGRNQTWTPEPLRVFFNTCYYAYTTQLTADIAAALGKNDDAAAYRRQAEQIAKAAHAAYFDAAKNTYVNGEQPYPAIALLIGAVPEPLRPKVMASLENEILVNKKGHIDSGVLGTYVLLKTLTRENRSDLIHPMVNQTSYPGWGDMLAKGATTMWEKWDGSTSQCHTSFLSVGSWFIEGVAGIRPDPASPGFKHFTIRPAVVGDLKFAKASYDSIRGEIAVDWRIEPGQFRLSAKVPTGSTATVYVPAKDVKSVRVNDSPANAAEGVKFLRMEGADAVFEVESGSYSFTAKKG